MNVKELREQDLYQGNLTVIFFKLFPSAPINVKNFLFPHRRFEFI